MSALDAEKIRHEILRERLETYGVAVRAGVITPNVSDEKALRKELGLPEINPAITDAWEEDGGARKPITLQGQKENAAQAAAIAGDAGAP